MTFAAYAFASRAANPGDVDTAETVARSVSDTWATDTARGDLRLCETVPEHSCSLSRDPRQRGQLQVCVCLGLRVGLVHHLKTRSLLVELRVAEQDLRRSGVLLALAFEKERPLPP